MKEHIGIRPCNEKECEILLDFFIKRGYYERGSNGINPENIAPGTEIMLGYESDEPEKCVSYEGRVTTTVAEYIASTVEIL